MKRVSGFYFALQVTRLMPECDLEFISEWSSPHIYVRDGPTSNSIKRREEMIPVFLRTGSATNVNPSQPNSPSLPPNETMCLMGVLTICEIPHTWMFKILSVKLNYIMFKNLFSASQKTLRNLVTKTNRLILFGKIEINLHAMSTAECFAMSASNPHNARCHKPEYHSTKHRS